MELSSTNTTTPPSAQPAAPATDRPMRVLAVCRTYEEIREGLREWAEKLNISREVIDERSGLQSGYSGKVLATNPSRNLGPITLPLMLEALGCVLVLSADDAELEKIERTLPKRDLKMVRHGCRATKVQKVIAITDYLKQIARRGGEARKQATTREQRQHFGRLGAAKRWGYRYRGEESQLYR